MTNQEFASALRAIANAINKLASGIEETVDSDEPLDPDLALCIANEDSIFIQTDDGSHLRVS